MPRQIIYAAREPPSSDKLLGIIRNSALCLLCRARHNRHTMASVLLEKETPLPVISDIIGHLDTNSTAIYLKVDMERLAQCPLDFEEVIHCE